MVNQGTENILGHGTAVLKSVEAMFYAEMMIILKPIKNFNL
jgi:hypothetical protein